MLTGAPCQFYLPRSISPRRRVITAASTTHGGANHAGRWTRPSRPHSRDITTSAGSTGRIDHTVETIVDSPLSRPPRRRWPRRRVQQTISTNHGQADHACGDHSLANSWPRRPADGCRRMIIFVSTLMAKSSMPGGASSEKL